MKKIMALLISMAMVVMAATGCGSGNSSDGDTSNGGKAVKVIDIALTQEEYAFGVDKNQPELLEEVNKFIAEIQADGTFDEILNRYFGDGEPQGVSSAKQDSSKDQLGSNY